MHIIIDCDDVLLDWQRGFRSWLFAHHNIRPDEGGPSSWSLAGWLGVPEARCIELIAGFNESTRFGELYAFPDAIEAVARLKANNHEMTVLTSCSNDPAVTARRKENLRREFDGAFDRIVCLGLGESKADWLKVLRSGIWIEDNYKNAMMGYDAGNKTFVMRRRHNRSDEKTSNPNLVWVDDWRPIVTLFS
jgi:hypothetical protein